MRQPQARNCSPDIWLNDAVAVMAENRSPHRARDETHRIDRERLERSHPRIRVWEEQFRKDEASDGAVEKEIVPLDRGADGGRNDRAAQLRLVFDRRKLDGSDV